MVHEALEAATRGRASGTNLRDFLHQISDSEQQLILEPLFKEASPSIGYRSLAALGRTKRVHVLNLNWDKMVEIACDKTGVPYHCFDLKKKHEWVLPGGFPPNHGVICVHVHGVLGDSCRYATLDTLSFEPEEIDLLEELFLKFPLLMTGTSLVGDMDFEDLWRVTTGKTSIPERWFFGRPWPSETNRATELDRSFNVKINPRCLAIDSLVDFDRLMLSILEAHKGLQWEEMRKTALAVELPESESLVTIQSPTFRSVLDARVIAIVGEPRLGKSTLAHFLAHYFQLIDEVRIDVRTFDRPETAATSIGSLLPHSGPAILVFDEPCADDSRSPGVALFIEQLLRANSDGSLANKRIIITSTRGRWARAVESMPKLTSSVAIVAGSKSAWYLKNELSLLASQDERVKALIEQGSLQTPAAIDEEIRYYRRTGHPKPPVNQMAAVADHLAVFDVAPQIAHLCCLVRLQEFTATQLSLEELLDVTKLSEIPTNAEDLLSAYTFEDRQLFRLRQQSAISATDQYLLTEISSIEANLENWFYPAHAIFLGLATWKLNNGLTSAPPVSSSQSSWLISEFVKSPTLASLRSALVCVSSEWAMTELCYEVVRLWHLLPQNSDLHELLQEIGGNRPHRGTYSLLEACLYHQDAVPRQILDVVNSEAWKIIFDRASGQEAALLVDACMWRPLAGGSMPSWVDSFFDRLSTSDPEWALVRFLAAYHPEGFAKLDAVYLQRDVSVTWNTDQAEFAAYLTRWHFVHQAYSRVLLSKLRIMDKAWLCRTLHPEASDSTTEMLRLIESMTHFPDAAGWAFHLGCNSACMRGKPNADLRHALREALTRSQSCDKGVATAVATYEPADLFQRELRDYFADASNVEFLLDLLSQGVALDGHKIAPPAFNFSRAPSTVHNATNITWPQLTREGVGTGNASHLTQELWAAFEKSITNGDVAAENVSKLCARVERGDLRILEKYAKAARAGVNPLNQIADTLVAEHLADPLFSALSSV